MAAIVPPTIAPTGAPDFSLVVADPGLLPRSPGFAVGLGEPELDEFGVELGLEEELEGLDVGLVPVPVPVPVLVEPVPELELVLPPPVPVLLVEPPIWTSITNLSSVI